MAPFILWSFTGVHMCTRLVVHQFPRMHARVGTVLQYMPTLSYNSTLHASRYMVLLALTIVAVFLTVTSWWCYR